MRFQPNNQNDASKGKLIMFHWIYAKMLTYDFKLLNSGDIPKYLKTFDLT